jgi:hypothetical protein
MKAMFFIVVMAVALLVLQTTVAPSLVLLVSGIPGLAFLSGHTLDLTLICLVYLVFHRDFLGSLLWAALLGILAGSFGTAWRGATAVSFFAVVFVGSFVKRQVLLETKLAVPLVIAGLTILEGLVHLEAGHLFSRIADPFRGQWGVLATQAFLNAAISVPLYFFLSGFDGWVGGRSGRESTGLLVGG